MFLLFNIYNLRGIDFIPRIVETRNARFIEIDKISESGGSRNTII